MNMRNFNKIRFALIILLLSAGVLIADSFDEQDLLTLRSSSQWHGINNFVADDSLVYAVYNSGVMVYRPHDGFLGMDTIAMIPLQHAYSQAFRHGDELILYYESGLVGFVDVGESSEPELISEIELETGFLDLEYYSNNLYVACGFYGVDIYSNEIRGIAEYQTTLYEPAHAVAVWVCGDVLYVVDDYNGIFIYDLSENAKNPKFIGTQLYTIPVRDIVCQGNTAYLANSSNGTIILDLADPYEPAVISEYETSSYIQNVTFTGDYLFASDIFGNYEVYHPDSSGMIAYLEVDGVVSLPLKFDDYTGDFLLTTDNEKIGIIQKIDHNWNLRGIDLLGQGSSLGQLALIETSLYIAAGFDPMLWHRVLNDFSLFAKDALPARSDAMVILDDMMFMADNYNQLLWIIRIESRFSMYTEELIPYEGEVFSLDVQAADDQSLNIALYSNNKAELINVNNQTLELNSRTSLQDHSSVYGGYFYDDYLYMSVGEDAVQLYDISDPSQPLELEEINFDGITYSYERSPGRLYTAGSAGLNSYYLVGPYPGTLRKSYNGPECIYHIVRQDSLIYCAAGDDGVLVLNDSDPDSFTVVASYQTPGFTSYLAVEDNLLIVSDRSGILVFEISQSGIPTGNPETVPDSLFIAQNYPNPFNLTTMIPVDIPPDSDGEDVELVIYNGLGQKIRVLANERFNPGRYVFEWDGTNSDGADVASGVYFYRCRVGDDQFSRKMILMK
jgi:hypothetical protein